MTPLISASSGFRRISQPLAAAALLVIAHLALLMVFDLAAHPAATLVCLFVAFIGLLLADRRLVRVRRPSVLGILLVATLLRLLFLALPPTLSNDILRYEWDGRVVAAGFNPYRLAPESAELVDLRDDHWQDMDHKSVPTVYPPLALSLFSVASGTPCPQLVIKTVLVGFDLISCWLLVVLATRLGVPVSRTIWYSWNPLTTLEVAGMGHIDALAVTATLTAVVCLMDRSGRPIHTIGAALATAAGVLAKFGPLVAVPLWSKLSPRPWWFVVIVAAAVIAVMSPVFLATGGVPPGLVTYGISWEFNGPIFEPLWRALDWLDIPSLLAGGLDRLKSLAGESGGINRIYPLLYPQFVAKVLLGLVLLAVIASTIRRSELIPGTARIFGWSLLCSATVYPWYLLWVLPWAALCRHPAWMLLSGLALLSYLPKLFAVDLWPWAYLSMWLPFLVLHYWYPRWSID